jgi:hypothetical protein
VKDDLECTAIDRTTEQLIPIATSLVSANRKIREERLNRFVKGDAMRGQLVRFEVIFEIRWLKLVPFHHRGIRDRSSMSRAKRRSSEPAGITILNSAPRPAQRPA